MMTLTNKIMFKSTVSALRLAALTSRIKKTITTKTKPTTL